MSQSDHVEGAIFKMNRHMELRGSAAQTVYTYVRCARRFLTEVGKAPDQVSACDVEDYLLDLGRRGRGAVTRNVNLAAIRCLLSATVGQDVSEILDGAPRLGSISIPDRS